MKPIIYPYVSLFVLMVTLSLQKTHCISDAATSTVEGVCGVLYLFLTSRDSECRVLQGPWIRASCPSGSYTAELFCVCKYKNNM